MEAARVLSAFGAPTAPHLSIPQAHFPVPLNMAPSGILTGLTAADPPSAGVPWWGRTRRNRRKLHKHRTAMAPRWEAVPHTPHTDRQPPPLGACAAATRHTRRRMPHRLHRHHNVRRRTRPGPSGWRRNRPACPLAACRSRLHRGMRWVGGCLAHFCYSPGGCCRRPWAPAPALAASGPSESSASPRPTSPPTCGSRSPTSPCRQMLCCRTARNRNRESAQFPGPSSRQHRRCCHTWRSTI
mmetsp:Transcript_15004/g.41247  ORF Transcript_15004/g.41247 Transcript_15004/m.41247 type:complete len:241 (-) Transcript_15004:423-1145(-)